MVLSGVLFFLCFCHVCQLHLLSLIPLVPTSCQLCEFRWVACSSPAASSTWKRVGEIDTALKTLGRPLREENLNQYAKITLSHRDTDVTAKLNHTGFHESEDWIDSWSVGIVELKQIFYYFGPNVWGRLCFTVQNLLQKYVSVTSCTLLV